MKTYHSFLIRCWVSERGAQGTDQLYDVQHLQSEGRARSHSLEEVKELIGSTCLPEANKVGGLNADDNPEVDGDD